MTAKTTNRKRTMTSVQELQVRTEAAKHLTGVQARLNTARIASLHDELYTGGALAEMAAHFGADEVVRCNALATAP